MGLFPSQSKTASGPVHSVLGTPIKTANDSDRNVKLFDLRWKHVQFSLLTGLTFVSCTLLTYFYFGWKGIEESILYHVKRRDHRHNFSPYWLMYYYDSTMKIPDIASSLIPFIPQALLSLWIAYSWGKRDFCFALLLQTFVFVSLNKVCTSQVLLLLFIV